MTHKGYAGLFLAAMRHCSELSSGMTYPNEIADGVLW